MAGEENVGVLVPGDQIAKVIGKAGAGLKWIREQSGCKIQVHPAQQGADAAAAATRRVDLSGTVDQVCAGFQALLPKGFGEGGTPVVLIPAERAGGVVGKGGENLKRIREACHVSINIEREPVVEPTTGQQERLLTMQGDIGNFPAALHGVLSPGSSSRLSGFRPAQGARSQIVGGPVVGGGVVVGAIGPSAASQGPRSQGVRPPSSDPDEIQLHMVVPDKFAGAVLGKGGTLVKQTATNAGCRVSVTAREGAGGDRRVVIIGGFSQCSSAQEIVHAQVAEAARESGAELNEVTVIYMVRRDAAGAVIGKQGAGLRAIREASGAKIQIQKDEVEGQRPCTISGTLQSVLQAEQAVFEAVRQVPLNTAGGGGGSVVGGATEATGGLPAAKRQRVDDPQGGSGTTKLLIPDQCARTVIGKMGAGLKEIRQTSGAMVEVLQQAEAPHWRGERVVILRGDLRARQLAVATVLRLAFPPPADASCVLKMLVNRQEAGSLIGRQGSNLRLLRETSGATVQVEREEVYGERLASASGAAASVAACAEAALHLLDTSSAAAAALGGNGTAVVGSPPPRQGGAHQGQIVPRPPVPPSRGPSVDGYFDQEPPNGVPEELLGLWE